MGFLFTQTTIVSAQCPIKEQIMNSGEDDNKQEQAKPADPTTRTLIIFYDKAKGNKPLLKAIKQNNCTLTYKYKEFNGVAIKVRDGWDIDKAIAYFKGVKGVLSVGKTALCNCNSTITHRNKTKGQVKTYTRYNLTFTYYAEPTLHHRFFWD